MVFSRFLLLLLATMCFSVSEGAPSGQKQAFKGVPVGERVELRFRVAHTQFPFRYGFN